MLPSIDGSTCMRIFTRHEQLGSLSIVSFSPVAQGSSPMALAKNEAAASAPPGGASGGDLPESYSEQWPELELPSTSMPGITAAVSVRRRGHRTKPCGVLSRGDTAGD